MSNRAIGDSQIRAANAEEVARMKADPAAYDAEIAAEVSRIQRIEDCKQRNVCPKCEAPLPHINQDGEPAHPLAFHHPHLAYLLPEGI